MPNESIRQRILDAMKASLASMTSGTSYWFTASGVYLWDMPSVETLSYPSFCILDTDEAVQRATTPLAHRTLTVTVIGVHSAELVGEGDRIARRLLADIQKCVQADRTWGGLAVTTNETSNNLMVDSASEPLVVVGVDLEVTYRTALGDPASTAP